MTQKTKRSQYGYLLWFVAVVAVFIGILVRVVAIQAEADEWLENVETYTQKVEAEATRGNIFACDGRLLASSLPYYNLFMDMQASEFLIANFNSEVDSLAQCLSRVFDEGSYQYYKQVLVNAFKEKKRYFPIAKRVSYTKMQEIKTFPIFRWGRKGGLICEEIKKRSNPFGYMVTMGRIAHDKERGTRGIEMQYDSLLKGKNGIALRQKLAGRVSTYNVVDPIDGLDLVTTIDVDIQDIVEKALRKKMIEIEAQHGCAVLMEVSTGEVKACVNLQRGSSGNYFEGQNWSVLRIEPGSTFKTMSLIVALEDKKVKMSDVIDTKEGIFRFYDRDMKESNWKHGGNGKITVEQVLAYSSNIGISRIIEDNYGDNPSRYVNKLYEMGLTKDLHLEIPGYELPNIRHPKDPQAHWYGTTLPWMSIGYELQLSPIYTLAFYNAIANNGVFIRPFFVKNITKNGDVIETYATKVINEEFCSKDVLKDIRRGLESVVEYGTGIKAQSKFVKIAGKTGTAQVGYGKGQRITHQVSFCGYFPSENPLYSCIVVIYNPHNGSASGGAMSGAVFKDIAEQVYARKVQFSFHDIAKSSGIESEFPKIKQGDYVSTKNVLEKMNSEKLKTFGSNVYEKKMKSNATNFASISKFDVIPNVVGMGAKDAVYLMEKAGLRVQIEGVGTVKSQSILAGRKAVKNQTVVLILK